MVVWRAPHYRYNLIFVCGYVKLSFVVLPNHYHSNYYYTLVMHDRHDT